jgi:hypothetical protein
LFIARIAPSVSFAETALTALADAEPPAAARLRETTGATLWKPKMCLVSVSTVYFEPSSCAYARPVDADVAARELDRLVEDELRRLARHRV